MLNNIINAVQRRGIGRAIISHLEQYANNHNYKSVTLSSSITAIEFYKKLGYSMEKDEIEEWLGEKIRSITMTKSIE